MGKTEGRYRVEVQADSTGTWASNSLRFDTPEEAEAYAQDLWTRWTAVKEWRVWDTERDCAAVAPLERDLD